jgi:hypothetical protein
MNADELQDAEVLQEIEDVAGLQEIEDVAELQEIADVGDAVATGFGAAEANLWHYLFVLKDFDMAADAIKGGANIDAQLLNFFGGYYCLEEGQAWDSHPEWWERTSVKELLGDYSEWVTGTELEGEGLEDCSALHIACWLGEPEKVMFCLENGASTAVYSKYYGYPRDITSDTGLQEMLDEWYDAVPAAYNAHEKKGKVVESAYAYEKLGDDYDQHPWVPPTFKKALEKKKANMFRSGEADIFRTRPTDMLLECGLGVTMYFSLLRWLSGLFLVMAVMAIPAMVLNHAGTNIPSSKQDGVGICRSSLGNMRSSAYLNTAQQYDCDSLTATEFAQRQREGTPCNESSINVWGAEISEMDAGYIQSALDLLQSLVFICFCVFLRMKAKAMVAGARKSRVVLEDYSVLVRNLPKGATTGSVIRHFNKLYPLVCETECDTPGGSAEEGSVADVAGAGVAKKGDWRGRTVERGEGQMVFDPLPVRSSGNAASENVDGEVAGGGSSAGSGAAGSGYPHNVHEATRSTWVAEVVLVYRNSADIRAYLSMQTLIRQLRRARAQVKMYADDTPLETGPNPAKHAKAEYMTLRIGSMLDELAKKIQKRASSGKEMSLLAAGVDENGDGIADDEEDTVAAFVTFNESLSCARCLEDYRNSRSWWGRYFQHKKLRLRPEGSSEVEKGVALIVSPAPQPASVLWENMDTSWEEKMWRRTSTRVASMCMLVVSFIMVLVAKQLQARYEQKIPDFNLCEEQVPSLYLRSYEQTNKFDWTLARQDVFRRSPLDTQCAKRGKWVELCDVGGSIPSITVPSVITTSNATTTATSCTFGSSATIYSVSACSAGLCPNPTLPSVCPCTNGNSAAAEICQTLPCFSGYEELVDVDRARVCESFSASTITACYCYKGLQRHMFDHGVFRGGQIMWDENKVSGLQV